MSAAPGAVRRAVLAWLGAAVLAPGLQGCATPDPERFARIRGTVGFLPRQMLDPEATVTVRLQDVSRMDIPAVVLAERRIRVGDRPPPFYFEFGVEPARIDPRARYTVAARIELGGKLLYINDTAYPVLTHGAGDTVKMILKRVAF